MCRVFRGLAASDGHARRVCTARFAWHARLCHTPPSSVPAGTKSKTEEGGTTWLADNSYATTPGNSQGQDGKRRNLDPAGRHSLVGNRPHCLPVAFWHEQLAAGTPQAAPNRPLHRPDCSWGIRRQAGPLAVGWEGWRWRWCLLWGTPGARK